jgi:type III secretion protein C
MNVNRLPARVAALALVVWSLCSTALAAPLPWRGGSFQIIANEKPLADFLRELAASQGTAAIVDPRVSGTISGRFSGQPLRLLGDITTTYALSWYYDGAFLFIDPASDVMTEVIAFGPGHSQRVAQALTQMGVIDHRFPVSVSSRDGTLQVSGPRRYVERVKQAVQQVDQSIARADNSEIRVFALRYGWASDFTIHRAGKEIVVPGVASVLRGLYGAPAAARGARSTVPGTPALSAGLAVTANREIKLSSGETIHAPKVEFAPPSAPAMGVSGVQPMNGVELPQIQADPRLNAVLVRDLPERMAQHERLIESMDVKPRLVEIEVAIMDVDSNRLDALGVDWRAHGRRADFQSGSGGSPALTFGGASTEAGQTININGTTAAPLGAVFTAAIGNSLRNFLLARVSALTQSGGANMVARPKLLTLDNIEASLENLSEFHVRVGGFQEVGLFKVTAGTALRVTPMIIADGDGRGVLMTINIEDGNLTAASVDSVPVIQRRSVNTQAMVAEGASLLIAGFSSEQTTTVTSGVPVLSTIPVVGNLFKYNEDKRGRQERLYMLTPRFVLPVPDGVAPGSSAPSSKLAPPTLPAPAAPSPPPATPVHEPVAYGGMSILPSIGVPRGERPAVAGPPAVLGTEATGTTPAASLWRYLSISETSGGDVLARLPGRTPRARAYP